MPDVVIVGGGIIGAASAFELARAGASVTLLEKDELAAGASGRNLGFIDLPKDPALDPMCRASVEMYLAVTEDGPVPVFLDREPIGTLAIAVDEVQAVAVREEADLARASGIRAERLDAGAVRALEPELTPEVTDAWLLDGGRRVDPGGLTVCLAHLARSHGATIRHHAPARRLLERGERVTGVVTDDEVIEADAVVLAAGPWSTGLLRPLGVALPVAGARGWLVHLGPDRPLISHWIEGAARTLFRMRMEPVTAAAFAERDAPHDAGPMLQPSPDGTVVVGTSREAALSWEPLSLDAPREIAAAAIRLVPALAEAPVLATWSGVRPMSPDERPLIGWVRDGLLVATGHGSEGVILGGGTAQQVSALVLGSEPPFDNAPFEPGRFAGQS